MDNKGFQISFIKMKGIDMKKNIMSLVMIIVALVLMVSIGCSEKKKERSPEESSIKRQKIIEDGKKSIKPKIDLLCLKYGVESEKLKNDLVDYLYTDLFSILAPVTNNGKNNDKKTGKKLIDKISSMEEIDTEKLIEMSKKYNVPISKISGIVYDYKIWNEIQNISQ